MKYLAVCITKSQSLTAASKEPSAVKSASTSSRRSLANGSSRRKVTRSEFDPRTVPEIKRQWRTQMRDEDGSGENERDIVRIESIGVLASDIHLAFKLTDPSGHRSPLREIVFMVIRKGNLRVRVKRGTYLERDTLGPTGRELCGNPRSPRLL